MQGETVLQTILSMQHTLFHFGQLLLEEKQEPGINHLFSEWSALHILMFYFYQLNHIQCNLPFTINVWLYFVHSKIVSPIPLCNFKHKTVQYNLDS